MLHQQFFNEIFGISFVVSDISHLHSLYFVYTRVEWFQLCASDYKINEFHTTFKVALLLTDFFKRLRYINSLCCNSFFFYYIKCNFCILALWFQSCKQSASELKNLEISEKIRINIYSLQDLRSSIVPDRSINFICLMVADEFSTFYWGIKVSNFAIIYQYIKLNCKITLK